MAGLGVTYRQALDLVGQYIQTPTIRFHLLETEAIMRSLARRLGENEEEWGIIGLLHDIDWEKTKENPDQHCLVAADILRQAGGSDFLIETIQSHAWGKGGITAFADKERHSPLQHALAAAETLTGLIVASALVQPDKKLESVRPESLKKKFKSPGFARNCRREIIAEIEAIGISLDEFLVLGLEALQAKSADFGL